MARGKALGEDLEILPVPSNRLYCVVLEQPDVLGYDYAFIRAILYDLQNNTLTVGPWVVKLTKATRN